MSSMLLFLLSTLLWAAHWNSVLSSRASDKLPLQLAAVLDTGRVGSKAPVRIELKGGLLHTSGYYANAKLGGQELKLQIDLSQGALTVPAAGCTSCRIGDKRYNPAKSSSSESILCDDAQCGQNKCDRTKCSSCSAQGACCGPGMPAKCAYNVVFADKSNANGTMYKDTLELGGISVPNTLFAAMYEESRLFEMPYVDGVLGMAFTTQHCYPTCAPAAMDAISAATGLPSVFTMCVNRYGGTLVVGSAAQMLAEESFKYVNMLNAMTGGYYHVRALSYGKVGNERVELPEIASGIFSSATTSIVVGKTTFLTILETVMESNCGIPGLCSTRSWFRPSSCHPLSDSDVRKMPTLTFFLSEDVKIELEPNDYLLPYKKSEGQHLRCVAFIVTNLLTTRKIGIMFGSVVMSRYAVSFDRANRRVGIARAKQMECGPTNGTDQGLEGIGGEISDPKNVTVLTADSPAADSKGIVTPDALVQSARCRALLSCKECAAALNCSYRYTDGMCIHDRSIDAGSYAYCSGQWCMCFAVSKTGWYLGIVVGAVAALVLLSCCVCAWRLRQRKVRYQEVVPFAENEVETF